MGLEQKVCFDVIFCDSAVIKSGFKMVALLNEQKRMRRNCVLREKVSNCHKEQFDCLSIDHSRKRGMVIDLNSRLN